MKKTYHYRWEAGEREAKCLEYACMTDNELIYEYLQPDCECCQHYAKFGGLPVWCSECGTLRDINEPLVLEIERRGIVV